MKTSTWLLIPGVAFVTASIVECINGVPAADWRILFAIGTLFVFESFRKSEKEK